MLRSGSQAAIDILKNTFAEQGIPDKLISDNGPHFSSAKFQKFAESWGFNHITSSPCYPQSNGFVERQIQTVKRTLEKAKLSNIDPDMALLILRSTPVDYNLPSPSELLNMRKMKSNLPIRLKNQDPGRDGFTQRLAERQHHQKQHYDRRAGEELAALIPNQPVLIRDQQTDGTKLQF